MESENSSGFSSDIVERIEFAVRCQDCQDIPKVPNAGQVYDEGTAHQVMHNGLKVLKGRYHGDWMTELISRTRGHHEPQEEKAFYKVLESLSPGSVMVELGSFWAYYSMWFHKRIENATNYLIEPTVGKLEIGKANFALNNMEGTFLNAFVGAKAEAHSTFTDWDGARLKLRQLCIDDFMREYDISCIDLLHADIQGAEYEMLRGATEAIADQRIKYFFISTHGHQHDRCLRLLERNRYRIICAHTIAESVSGDGLIVARAEAHEGVESIEISKRHVPAWERLSFYLRTQLRQIISD